MSSHGSHGMPRHMCDDILRGSSYGLDFSVIAKDWVIVAAPGCATAISARLTIPGRVGPVARHVGPQDHRVVDDPVYRRCGRFQDAYPLVSAGISVSTVAVTTEMHGRAARGPRRQGCNRGAVRGLRAVRRHTASTAGAVPGAILDVVTRGSHRGAAAVAVNRTGSRHPEGVGHVRLGESTPVHRT